MPHTYSPSVSVTQLLSFYDADSTDSHPSEKSVHCLGKEAYCGQPYIFHSCGEHLAISSVDVGTKCSDANNIHKVSTIESAYSMNSSFKGVKSRLS